MKTLYYLKFQGGPYGMWAIYGTMWKRTPYLPTFYKEGVFCGKILIRNVLTLEMQNQNTRKIDKITVCCISFHVDSETELTFIVWTHQSLGHFFNLQSEEDGEGWGRRWVLQYQDLIKTDTNFTYVNYNKTITEENELEQNGKNNKKHKSTKDHTLIHRCQLDRCYYGSRKSSLSTLLL